MALAVGRRLVSQAKRKSVDAVLRLRDDPKGPARFGMPLAIIVDDRIEVRCIAALPRSA